MKSTDGQYDISANLDIKKEMLDDVTYWEPEQECWIPIDNIKDYKELQFIAIPKIKKESDVIFGFDDTRNTFCSIRSRGQSKVEKRDLFSFFSSHQDVHSFPTRRSSDLKSREEESVFFLFITV
jgi:hypothetical protein